jgi:2-hydroxycyclohexanecarboxyl-CoA dehydrogenase
METGLRGKSVVITGGANNIGRGIVRGFGAEGARVVVGDIDEKGATAAAEEVRGHAVRADVTDPESAKALIGKAIELNGGVDVLVNCAGGTVDRLFLEKQRSEWEREIAINQWGFINCTRAVLDHFVERGGGVVVSISSDAGRVGEFREVVYAGTKAAIIAMSKSLAKELGPQGIRLNVVCPGFVPGRREGGGDFGGGSMWAGAQGEVFPDEVIDKVKRLYPLRRVGTPEDIAPAVVFLASDAASWITGQTLSVSGGYTML